MADAAARDANPELYSQLYALVCDQAAADGAGLDHAAVQLRVDAILSRPALVWLLDAAERVVEVWGMPAGPEKVVDVVDVVAAMAELKGALRGRRA